MLSAHCCATSPCLASAQGLKSKWKEDRKASAAALHLPSAQANRHLALMSYERGDSTVSQALMQMSLWSENYLQQPNKPFFPGKLAAVIEAGVIKSLMATSGQKR